MSSLEIGCPETSPTSLLVNDFIAPLLFHPNLPIWMKYALGNESGREIAVSLGLIGWLLFVGMIVSRLRRCNLKNDLIVEKLKKNIVSIPDGAIANVKQLRPVNFDWKDETAQQGNTGFVAQEVKAILPNLVNGEEWDGTEGKS